MVTPDRRRSPRRPLAHPAKLRDDATGRYLAARTINRSETGVLLEVPDHRRIHPGQTVRLAIAEPGAPVISASSMIPATVVRTEPNQSCVRVALAFGHPYEQPSAAA